MRLEDENEPLFDDLDGDVLEYSADAAANGFLVRIQTNASSSDGPTITDGDNLCVTGRSAGGAPLDEVNGPFVPQVIVTATDESGESTDVIVDVNSCCAENNGGN